MSRFGDGLATGADLRAAAAEASLDAVRDLSGRPDLVCAFVATDDPSQVAAAAEQVAAVTGARVLLGCSAGGVLAGGRGVEGSPAVSVLAAVLPDVGLRPFHLEVLPADRGAAVVGLPEVAGDEVALLLADPYSFPVDGFLLQANATLPGLALVGALAHGPRGAGSTRLLLDGRVVDRGAVGVLVHGATARTVVSQGCRPVGPAMTVTAARGNVVLGLAGRPALRKVEQVLADLPPDEQAMASAGLCLGLAVEEVVEDHDYLVRAILGVDGLGVDGLGVEATGLAVGGRVEVGQTARLQVRDADAADADLRVHLAALRRDDPRPPGGVLLFSCNGRGARLFGPSYGGADHDPALVRDLLSAQAVAGLFAGGELGPVAGRNHLHAFSASLLVLPA